MTLKQDVQGWTALAAMIGLGAALWHHTVLVAFLCFVIMVMGAANMEDRR